MATFRQLSSLNTYRASSQQCARGALSSYGQKFDPESLYEPRSVREVRLKILDKADSKLAL